MASRVSHTSFDSLDAWAMSVFWGGVLGFGQDPDDPNEPGHEECMIFSPDGSQRLLFIEVADAKVVKNRLHLDLEPVEGSRDAELERLLSLGARQVADRRRPDGSGWVVLADPEGNEFCILRHRDERTGATPRAQQRRASQVLVDLDVLITPADEERVARAVRAAVAAVAPAAALGPARWEGAGGGEDLVHQWAIEQGGAPLDGRRVRRLTMDVHAQDAADLLEEIVWAAIDAVCPTAREEHPRLDTGEAVMPIAADRYPWSSATRVADDDR